MTQTTADQVDDHLQRIAGELDEMGQQLEAEIRENLPEIRRNALKQADRVLHAFDDFLHGARARIQELEQAENGGKEAYGWSELRPLVRQYVAAIANGDKTARFFAYGSLIKNPGSVKPNPESQPGNEEASLQGYVLGMNLFASGPHEYRGTNRPDLGVVNTGLYVGMENDPEGQSFGVNVTVRQADFAKAFEAYARRELGNPPYAEYFADLFSNKPLEKLPAIDAAADGFPLYKLVAGTARTHDGRDVPVLSVATNERSPLAAIGLTPLQAAYYILDGIGFERRNDKGDILGGSALKYFTESVMKTQAEQGFNQPRLNEIAEAVQALAGMVHDAHYASAMLEQIRRETDNLTVVNAAQELAAMTVRLALEKTKALDVKQFDASVAVLRDEVPQAEIERQLRSMPKSDAEKALRIAGLADQWMHEPGTAPGGHAIGTRKEEPFAGPYAKAFGEMLTPGKRDHSLGIQEDGQTDRPAVTTEDSQRLAALEAGERDKGVTAADTADTLEDQWRNETAPAANEKARERREEKERREPSITRAALDEDEAASTDVTAHRQADERTLPKDEGTAEKRDTKQEKEPSPEERGVAIIVVAENDDKRLAVAEAGQRGGNR